MRVYRVQCGENEYIESDSAALAVLSSIIDDAEIGTIYTIAVEEMTEEEFASLASVED